MKRIVWLNLVLGVWLVLAPFVIDSGAATGLAMANTVFASLLNDVVVGLILIGGSWWVLVGLGAGVSASGLGAVAGIWLILAPSVMGYSALRLLSLNDMAVGVLVLVASSIEAWALVHQPSTKTA
jgi:hypothetical protein